MNHRLNVLTSVALVALTAAGVAAASEGSPSPSPEDVKAAEADFNKGREAYKRADYAEAGESFESADTHAPKDRVLELAINARNRAGNIDRAATLAQYGLEHYPESERLRKIAGPLVERGQADMYQLTVQCDEACTLILDGTRPVHGGPATRRIVFLTPGDHLIRAVWADGHAEVKNAGGKAGESASMSFKAVPAPRAEPPKAPTRAADPTLDQGPGGKSAGLPPLYFLMGTGATVALGGVTFWSGIDTLHNPGADKVKRECDARKSDCQSLYDKGRSSQTRTNVLIGATSVVGVATAIIGLFATRFSSGSKKDVAAGQGLSITPFFAYHSGPTLGAVARF